jgi:hypothetical protein
MLYTVRSITRAKNVAETLSGELEKFGFDRPALSAAQETAARLMGHADWQALIRQATTNPAEGIEDFELVQHRADPEQRRIHQIRVLAERHAVPPGFAPCILDAVRPTGRLIAERKPEYDATSGLPPLDGEDVILASAITTLSEEFDAMARQILRIIPVRGYGIQLGITPRNRSWADYVDKGLTFARGKDTDHINQTRGEEISLWERAAAPGHIDELAHLDGRAYAAADRLWEVAQGLGPVPHLLPVTKFRLQLQRELSPAGSNCTMRSHRSPIEAEPWIELGHSIRTRWGGVDIEANASRWVRTRLATRRAFLDAGWRPEGRVWMVSWRVGDDQMESNPVLAADAASAIAWATASAVAARRIERFDLSHQKVRVAYVEDADGGADLEKAVYEASQHPIWSSPLLDGVKLRAVRSSKPPTNWTENGGDDGQRSITWHGRRPPKGSSEDN